MLQFIKTYGRTKSRNMDTSIMENNHNLQNEIPTVIDNRKIHLEIGFGNGENIIHRSKLMPQSLQVGVDVYKNGICKILKHIKDKNITNIVLLNKDARAILNEDFTICYLYIMFPDPWHKKSEKKRNKKRLINQDFLTKILSKLGSNGHFIFATDHKDYYDNIKTYIVNIGQFQIIEETVNTYPVMENMANYFVQSNYEKKATNPRYYVYYRPITK